MKAIEFSVGIIAATTNKILERGSFVGKPSDNDSLLASIHGNGVTKRRAVNNRGEPRPKINVIHGKKN